MLPEKVLIIDDDKMVRLTTGFLLSKHMITVFQASNGAEGIDLAKKEIPNLILLDIMMPVMDGWEVLDHLRIDPQTADIPVVLFTAGDYYQTEKLAHEKGVSRIIKKPFHIEEFIEQCDII